MSGSANQLQLTASQVTAQFASLQAVSTPFSLVVTDTAANVVANLADIEFFAQAGELSSINLTDGGTPNLSLAAAQVVADAPALNAISGSFLVNLPAGTALTMPIETFAQFPTAVLNAVSGGIVLTEAGASVPTSFPSSSNFISSILFRVTLELSAAQALAGPGAIPAWILPGLEARLEVRDSAANVAANITALAALPVSVVAFTDSGTPVLSLSAAQWSGATNLLATISGGYTVVLTDSGVPTLSCDAQGAGYSASLVSHVSGNFDLALSGVTAAAAAVDAQQPHVTSVNILDSGQFIASYLDTLQTLAASGELGSIQINAGDVIGVSATQWATDAEALTHITGNYSLNVAGVSAADAVQMAAQPHVTGVSISDTASQIVAHLGALVSLASSGVLLRGIVSDEGPFILTAAQALSAASLLENQFENVGTSIKVVLDDSSANILADLTALDRSTWSSDGTPFSSVVLTDGGSPTLTVTAAEVSSDFMVLPFITSSHTLVVSDSSTQVLDYLANVSNAVTKDNLSTIILTDAPSVLTLSAYAAAQGPLALTHIAGKPEILVSDTAAEVSVYLGALETIADGANLVITLTDAGTPLLGITTTSLVSFYHALDDIQGDYQLLVYKGGAPTSPDLSLTGAQLANVSAILGHLIEGYSISVSGATTAAAATSALLPDVVSLSVADTSQDVSATLNTLQAYAAAGKLSGISLTDTAVGAISLTSAQLTSDATALGEISGNFSLTISPPSFDTTIVGLAGHANTVEFNAPSSQYEIVATGNGVSVSSAGITIDVTNVTALQFSDIMDIVASQTPSVPGAVSSAQVTELYGAALGRMPDVAGLAFYEAFAAANPATPFLQYAEWFLSSPEYVNKSAHDYAQTVAGDQQFITDCYENLLHRTPIASEVAFYETEVITPMLKGLTAGTAAYTAAVLTAHAQVLAYFSQSPEFLADVQITAQNPSSAQHWLLLI